MENKRCAQLHSFQREHLIAFIEEHPELKSGKFNKDFTFKKAQDLWEQLTNALNSMPGARKNWKQWRKTWQDLRFHTKRKSAMINQNRNLTGGGPSLDVVLDVNEERILHLIGTVAVEGHPNVNESLVEPISFEIESNNDVEVEENIENVNFIPHSGSSERIELEHSYVQTGPPPTTVNKRKPVRTRRLENTIVATQKLSTQMEKKISMKQLYYETKSNYLKKKADYLEKTLEIKQQKLQYEASIGNSLKILSDKCSNIM